MEAPARALLFVDDQRRTDLPNAGDRVVELTPKTEHHLGVAIDGRYAEYRFTLKANEHKRYIPILEPLIPIEEDGPVPEATRSGSYSVPMGRIRNLNSVEVMLNDEKVEMIVNSGAEVVSIPWAVAKAAT